MEKSILLHCISPDEFKQIIKEVIREELLEVKIQLQEKKDSEILMTRKETCEFFKIDSTTLWNWTNKGKIDSYGIGNRRYYKKEDLLNSLVLLKVKRA
ncbi:helix-turn-helix domain-containing protein [Flavobacterium myungsuense]|uniref:Helix-turn-helix domain-containing protein n=2 Tax=Flavobacterium myungsuense TaxID=651823 RepID=A0ABW3J157_9FLAO